jgi:hypothetical protein
MTEVTLTTPDQALIADVVKTLKEIMFEGAAVFDDVGVIESADQFVYSNDPLKGTRAGVVGSRGRRRRGGDNSQAYVVALSADVVIRINATPGLGGDVQAAMTKLDQLTELVRTALMVDQLRNNNANRIMFDGKLIEGTNVEGDVRAVGSSKKGASFYAVEIPVVVGYSIATS